MNIILLELKAKSQLQTINYVQKDIVTSILEKAEPAAPFTWS